ncbi:MAG TPA: hypothetical protein VGM33_16370 [Baekduia sp.]|jgi:hypothetical protein
MTQIDDEVLTLAQVDYLDLWMIARVLTATFGDDLPGDAPTVALEAVERLVLAGALRVGGLVFPGEFVASPDGPATAMAAIRRRFADIAGPLGVGDVGWFALVERGPVTDTARPSWRGERPRTSRPHTSSARTRWFGMVRLLERTGWAIRPRRFRWRAGGVRPPSRVHLPRARRAWPARRCAGRAGASVICQLEKDIRVVPAAFAFGRPAAVGELTYVIPEALRDLWTTFGAGTMFETEELLDPTSDLASRNAELHDAGLAADLLAFHVGLYITAVDASGSIVAVAPNTLEVTRHFGSLDEWYADLRAEYARTYGLPELDEPGS